MALLRLQPRDDPDDLRAGLHAVLLGQRAARLLVVVALEVDAVVDEADRDDRRGPRRWSLASLAFETAMSWSNCGVSSSSACAVRLGPDAARMGGGDEVRPALAGLAEGDDRARRDGLGAVHVGVDDVGPDLGQVGRQGPDRDRVVGLLDDEDRDAGPLELADGAARRERDDRDVVARRVDPGHERVEVLLGAAVRAGREDLDDADPPRAGERRARRRASRHGIPGQRGAHARPFRPPDEQPLDRLVRRRPTRTCSPRRRGGSRAAASPVASARSM